MNINPLRVSMPEHRKAQMKSPTQKRKESNDRKQFLFSNESHLFLQNQSRFKDLWVTTQPR